MPRTCARRPLLVSLAAPLFASCRSLWRKDPPSPGSAAPNPTEPAPVKKVEEEIVVAAWAEPSRLPKGGGQAQLLVRVQKRGGARFPGVEVSLGASTGRLYSAGRVLVTDGQGMTRDRITATRTVTITLNAGGTRYRFKVPVGEAE